MNKEIILASKSGVRKQILEKNQIDCSVEPSNIDEDLVKESLLKENASPEIISKNLAELKANKISQKRNNNLVLGADSVIDLNGKIISKPLNREEALKILIRLNGKTHHLISSVCISQNGSMIWNHTDKASLTMKQMSEEQLKKYLAKISDETEVSLPLRNMISMIAGASLATWAYFGLVERLNKLETNYTMQTADVQMNTEFRIKWPRGEMGSLPADSEQFMLIEHLAGELEKLQEEIETGQAPFDQQQKLTLEFYEKRINSMEEQIEKLKDAQLQIKTQNGH